jgi:hypothetical protein
MADYIEDYASLNNLMDYAVGTRQQQPEPTAQPRLPLPGIGAPLDDAAMYGEFNAAAPAVQPRPTFMPQNVPALATVAPVPRAPPPGNSNDQVGLLRDALKRVESSGNYQAKNPVTSASGAYQYTDGTWAGYGGYKAARYAPQHVQDARANEDLIKSLRKFNGDPFAVIANHMLPKQAKQPWLWTQPSFLKQGKRTIRIPPVIDYVRKVVKGTPYENELNAYMAAYLPRQRG